jgi:putative NADH-flavin reductase
MKIAVIGASGSVGSRIVAEALAREHEVTGVARRPERLSPAPRLQPVAGDIANMTELGARLSGHVVVVSSVRFIDYDISNLLTALEIAGNPRLVMVGGAGSLLTASGTALSEAPTFPEAVKPEAKAGAEKLAALRAQTKVDWSFLSPSALFAPGERTGKFRVGGDQLLVDGTGKSWISQEDFAIALLNEIETPKHSRQRFTVGY